MRLQRIYSSKLYVTSARKDKIHAAIQDPINAELVQQLSDYLDEAGQEELAQAANKTKPANDTVDTGSSGTGNSRHEPSAGGSSSFSGDVFSDFGDDELADVEPIVEGEAAETPAAEAPAEPTEAEASTTIAGTPITANTTIIWTTLDDVVSDCDVIHGTLNSREDTKGVSRLQVKDNELWIYFHDDFNLNDKMIDVIEVLNSTGYTYLKFNRLARSNNAIVFDISLNSQDDIKTVSEIAEEVK